VSVPSVPTRRLVQGCSSTFSAMVVASVGVPLRVSVPRMVTRVFSGSERVAPASKVREAETSMSRWAL
jgi:hypothetical protein